MEDTITDHIEALKLPNVNNMLMDRKRLTSMHVSYSVIPTVNGIELVGRKFYIVHTYPTIILYRLNTVHLKKKCGRGERTPPFFIKRKQHGFTRPRKNLPNPVQCPRGPSLAASTARFFYPQTEIRPSRNLNSRPCGTTIPQLL